MSKKIVNMKIVRLIKTPCSDEEFRCLYNELSMHEKDLLIECKACGAKQGNECRGLRTGIVHFGRRLLRVLKLKTLEF